MIHKNKKKIKNPFHTTSDKYFLVISKDPVQQRADKRIYISPIEIPLVVYAVNTSVNIMPTAVNIAFAVFHLLGKEVPKKNKKTKKIKNKKEC